jgi:hypothetical protein
MREVGMCCTIEDGSGGFEQASAHFPIAKYGRAFGMKRARGLRLASTEALT